jgi:AcrR family transcriptional regulator
MPRWEPDSARRLADAAFALYSERGFENTTVAEIAARAGVTERTFFRHFADKREVLFAGAGRLEEAAVNGAANAPESATPLDMAAAGLEAAAALLTDAEFSRRRQRIISANVELRERELSKLASLSATLADALRRRGVGDPIAGLTAEVAMTVFRMAFERWIDEGNDQSFPQLIHESLEQLKAVTEGRDYAPSATP